jgi:hypothetical protein
MTDISFQSARERIQKSLLNGVDHEKWSTPFGKKINSISTSSLLVRCLLVHSTATKLLEIAKL